MSAIGELTGFLTRETTASKSTQPDGRPDEKLVTTATVPRAVPALVAENP
jgi:hypothetical protein